MYRNVEVLKHDIAKLGGEDNEVDTRAYQFAKTLMLFIEVQRKMETEGGD